MRNNPDGSPRSEKAKDAPASSSAAQNAESDHYKPWSKLTSDEQSRELEQFFKRWQAPAHDIADCPPEAELLDAAEDRSRPEWEHIKDCENCRSLVKLISDPERVRIPVNRILAEASQRAWKIEHSARRRSFTWRHVHSLYHSFTPHQRTALLGFALATLVLVAGLIGYQYSVSNRPSHIVAFQNNPTKTFAQATAWLDKANEIASAPNWDAATKVHQLEPLNLEKPNVETAITQSNLDSSQRAKAGTLVAAYNNQVKVLEDSPDARNVNTKDLPLNPTEESKIVSKVWLVFGSTPGERIVFNRQDAEASKTILKAAEFTEVTAIEPKNEKAATVSIKLPANLFEEDDLNNRKALLKKEGIDLIVALDPNAAMPLGHKSKLKALQSP